MLRRRSPAPHELSGGTAIENIFYAALLAVFTIGLVLIIGRLLVRRREERAAWESDGRPEPLPRTPEEEARDRRTGITWGCLALAVPTVLVLAYLISR